MAALRSPPIQRSSRPFGLPGHGSDQIIAHFPVELDRLRAVAEAQVAQHEGKVGRLHAGVEHWRLFDAVEEGVGLV
jgi:hypothetical protein